MEELKIFEVGQKYYVLTYTKENAIEIVNDEEGLTLVDNEFEFDEFENAYSIDDCKECNYSDETYQPIEIMKNLFNEDEIAEIKKELEYDQVYKKSSKNSITYLFDTYEFQEYDAVLLTFYEILNPLILSEIEKHSIIAIKIF